MKIKIKSKSNLLKKFNIQSEQNDDEEAQFLKSRLTDKELQEPGVKDLLKLGYIPIVKSVKKETGFEHSILLGQGVTGRTYEVSKNNKLYVAKIVKKKSDNLSEFNIRKEIEKIRPDLPEEVSKHLIKHYLIDDTTSKNYFIYIMDKMRPMNKYEEKLLYQGHRGGMSAKSMLSLINKDIAEFYNFLKEWIINSKELKHIYYYIPLIKTVYLEGLKKEFLDIMKNIISSLKSEKYLDEFIFASTLEESLNEKIYNMYIIPKWDNILQNSNGKNFDIRDAKAVFIYEIREAAKEYIRRFLSTVFFGSKQSNKPIDTSAAFEKQKSFIDALEYIAQHYGIHWDDLHRDNVMIDPKTNEYVAVDIR